MPSPNSIAVGCSGHLFRSKIVTGDALKTLKKQPSDLQFDVVIADPPYNIGKDFGNNGDSMPIDDYVEWCNEWIFQCFRLLAKNGLIYVYGFHEVLARVAVKYPIDEQRWLAWHYTNKAVPSSKFWQRSHEAILCLWKPGTKRPPLEIEQIREPYTAHFQRCTGKVRKGTNGRYSRSGKQTIYNDNGGALPRDVLDIPALAGGAGRAERWFACRDCGGKVKPPSELSNHAGHDILKHPTQKPMTLTKRDTVLKINLFSVIFVRRFYQWDFTTNAISRIIKTIIRTAVRCNPPICKHNSHQKAVVISIPHRTQPVISASPRRLPLF